MKSDNCIGLREGEEEVDAVDACVHLDEVATASLTALQQFGRVM